MQRTIAQRILKNTIKVAKRQGVNGKELKALKHWAAKESARQGRIVRAELAQTSTKQWAAGGNIPGRHLDPKAVRKYLEAIHKRDGVKMPKI